MTIDIKTQGQIYPFSHSPVYPSTHLSIRSFIHPTIHTPTHPFTCPYMHTYTHTSIHLSVHPPKQASIHLSIHPPTQLAIHPSIHLSIHVPIHAFIVLIIQETINVYSVTYHNSQNRLKYLPWRSWCTSGERQTQTNKRHNYILYQIVISKWYDSMSDEGEWDIQEWAEGLVLMEGSRRSGLKRW